MGSWVVSSASAPWPASTSSVCSIFPSSSCPSASSAQSSHSLGQLVTAAVNTYSQWPRLRNTFVLLMYTLTVQRLVQVAVICRIAEKNFCYQKCYWPEYFNWMHSKNPQCESIFWDSSRHYSTQRDLTKASHVVVVCSGLLYTEWTRGYRKWHYWRQIKGYSSISFSSDLKVRGPVNVIVINWILTYAGYPMHMSTSHLWTDLFIYKSASPAAPDPRHKTSSLGWYCFNSYTVNSRKTHHF